MKLLVISDSHIIKTGDGKYWSKTAVHGYDFWERYTEIFEEVHVVSRVKKLDKINVEEYTRADGAGVKIVDLPFVRGFYGYIKSFVSFSKAVKGVMGNEEAAIFRVPSLPAFILLRFWKKTKKPYCFEVIADPQDCYKENKVAQKLFTFILKKECMKANGVSYVTKYFLENRYPCKALKEGETENYFSSYYSSINLEESFFGEPRKYEKKQKIKLLNIVSTINSDNKGHSTLIKIVSDLVKKGKDVELQCVGIGDKVEYYKQMAINEKIEDRVRFLGVFSKKEELRNLLMETDIFLFPSKAEGLPRTVIEAMAVGVPCLASNVNGIPELLDKEYLFDPLDVAGFANKIEELMSSPEELTKMSIKNIEKAKEYKNDILKERRNSFYKKLKESGKSKKKYALMIVPSDFPDGDAGAVRDYAFGKIYQNLGYEVVLIGNGKKDKKGNYNNIEYYSLYNERNNIFEHFLYYFGYKRRLVRYISAIEKKSGKPSLIHFNHVSESAMNYLIEFAKKNGITILHDSTEWYSPCEFRKGIYDKSYILKDRLNKKIIKNPVKVVAISTYLETYFRNKGLETIRIPVILELEDNKIINSNNRINNRDVINFVYAGNPGGKDYLKQVIKGFMLLSKLERKKIKVHILGIDRKQFVQISGLSEVDSCFIIYGRVTRDRVLDIMRNMDFSILLRPENERYAKAGFPTKVVEAMGQNVAMICNFTSDLYLYLEDGRNAITVNQCTAKAFSDAVRRVLRMDVLEIQRIKNEARKTAETYFDYNQYIYNLGEFLRNNGRGYCGE